MASNAPGYLSDEEFKATFMSPAPMSDIADTPELSDEEFKQTFMEEDPSVKQPQKGQVSYVGNLIDNWASKWQDGKASVVRGAQGARILGGELDYDSVKHDLNIDRLKQVEKESGAVQQEIGDWDWRNFIGTAIESLPFMIEASKGGLKGAAGGAVAGGGAALIAGQLGPQVAVPEELATVPSAAIAGGTWGFRAGTFYTSSKLMAGQTYLDFRDAGLSDGVARPAAIASGAISGLIETVQLGQLSSAARLSFVKQLQSGAGKTALRKFLATYTKEVGYQMTEEELQTITQLVAQSMGSLVENNKGAMPTADDWKNQVIDTFNQSLKASTVLVGASRVTGKVAGKTVNAIAGDAKKTDNVNTASKGTKKMDFGAQRLAELGQKMASGNLTLAQAMEVIKFGMEQTKPTEEEVAQVKAAPVESALDAVSKPLFDESGNMTTEAKTAASQELKSAVDNVTAQFNEKGQLVGGVTETVNAPTDPVIDQALGGAPSVEVAGRIRQVKADLKTVDASIAEIEKDFNSQEQVNDRVSALKDDLAGLKNQQKIYAAQITQLNKDLKAKDKQGKKTDAINKTLDKIGTQQEATVNQIEKAQAELDKLQSKSTEAKLARLEKLYDRRAAMEEDLALLKGGAYEAEDLKGLDIKVKADKVLALRAKAVGEAIKKFRQGVREGRKYTQDEVKAVQTQLVSLLRNSDLTLQDKGKFLAQIKNIRTVTDLQKALPAVQNRIDTLVEKENRRVAEKRLGTVLKRASLKKGGKRPVGKYTIDEQKLLDTYAKAINDKGYQQTVLARAADRALANSAGQTLDTPVQDASIDQLVEETIVKQVVNATDSNSINHLADVIQTIIDTGRAKVIEAKIKEHQELQELVSKSLVSIDGIRPVDSRNPANSKLSTDSFKNNALTRLLKTLGRTQTSWDGNMAIISQNDPEYGMRTLADVHDAMKADYHNKVKQKEKMIDTVVKASGGKAKTVLDRTISGSVRKKIERYVDADGVYRDLYLSRNEAIKLYMQFQDPELARGLYEGNRYTRPEQVSHTQKSTLGVLNEYLTDDDKRLAQGLLQFYADYYDRVNAEWEDETGASLNKNPNYSGYAKRSADRQSNSLDFFEEQFSRSSAKPKSTMFRTDNPYALEPVDAFRDALKHIEDFEGWMAWRKTDKRLRAIFGNKDVRNTIKLKYGDGMLRTIDNHYADMVGTRMKQNEDAFKWMSIINRNAGTAFVGGKLLQFFKQSTAIVYFLHHVSGPEFVAGVADFMLNPVKAIKTMEQSELLQERHETWDKDYMDALVRDDVSKFRQGKIPIKAMMAAVKYGDRATVWMGGWAVYKAELRRTGDEKQALRAFEKAFNGTQSSGTIDQRSQLERSGTLGKIVTLFLKQPMQMIEYEIRDIRRALAVPSVNSTYQAVRTMVINRVGQAMFETVASIPALVFGDDDDAEEVLRRISRAATLGAFTGAPMFGDILNAVSIEASNWIFDAKDKVWRPKFLPLEAGFKTYDMIHDFFKAMSDGEMDAGEVFTILHDYARSVDLIMPAALGGGLPKEPALKFMEWLFTEPED